MGLEILTLGSSKTYTRESLLGLGSLKGAPCTIKSITEVDGGQKVTFEWTGTSGTKQTSEMTVKNGVSVTGVSDKGNGTFTLLLSDGSESDPIQTVKGDPFTYSDFTAEQLEALKVKGDAGIGISKIEKINTIGLVDTYRITFSDNTTFDYEVKNGANGSGGGVSKWSEISEKPFESLSTDFSVENGELKVVGGTSNVQLDDTLTDQTKAANAKAVGDKISELKGDLSKLSEEIANLGSGTGTIVSSVEPMDDDIPKVFLTGDEYGNMNATKNEVNMEMEYVSKTLKFHSYILIKWQGSSSITNGYPKHNFTVKMFEDEARETKKKLLFKDWKFEKNKYVWKANYIDVSHARNIVCARLWSEVVASRSDYNTLPEELRTSPNNGAIDGFPIKVYVNGTYDGIYTWNIGKDDWMWNMDEYNPNHLLVCAEQNVSGENPCNFNQTITAFGDGNWSVEVGTPSADLVTSFNNLITCVKDTDDETFKSTIGNYLDIQSAIDYYAFHYAICGLDGLGKNVLMGTFDGVKWIIGSYDMDSVLGLYWNGSQFVSPEYACPEDYQAKYSLLWQRIEKVFKEELQTRYFELRKSVLSFSNICTHFERFMDSIGTDLYKDDSTLYPRTLSNTNNITQIRNFVRDRLVYVDNEIANLAQTTYTITNNLTGATTDNTTTVVTEGSSYVATITADAGSEINSVVVTMGGTDVTSTVYADGVITISSVTGDIVITVVAQSGISGEGLLYSLPEATTFDGTNYVDTGVDVLETNSDWTIVIDVEIPTTVDSACIIFSNAPTTLGSQTDTVEFHLISSGQGRAYLLSTTNYLLGYNKGIGKGVHAKLVFTRDSATPISKISYSVNGTVKTPVSNTFAYDGTKSRNNIILGGCLNDTTLTSGFVGGVINDFRIYNRVLTDPEITTYIS